MRRLISLPSFSPVAAGSTATLDLPTISVYDQLRLHYVTAGADATKALMEAELTEIRVKVNGKVQRRLSAAHINALLGFRGVGFNDGYLPIMFSEPWRRSVQGEDSLSWGMADVDTFQLEVDIDGGAVNPSLEATAVKTPSNRPMGPVVKYRQFTVNVAAVGIVNVTTLPKSDAYYGLHAVSADIDDVEIKIDQEEVFDAVLANANDYYKQQGLTPQTGYFHVVFDPTNRVSDALAMRRGEGQGARQGQGVRLIKDFRIDFNMSAANSFTLITETIGLRD